MFAHYAQQTHNKTVLIQNANSCAIIYDCTCDSRCYDYTDGHICKCIHRVHSLKIAENGKQSVEEQGIPADLDSSSGELDMLACAESTRPHEKGLL